VSLRFRLYTDFVCPFCFIAEKSTVPRLLEDLDMTLEWHGFELHPTTPRGGMPLTRLFGNVNLDALHARTLRFAAGFGVTGFRPPDHLHNTRRALAIAELARDQGALDRYRHAAFDANFRYGKNLESDTDLRELSVWAGLDPEQALRVSNDPAYLERVDARQAQARAEGINGIPTFVFGNERVVGCLPYETLKATALRAGATAR
jgi:predicted DsbA family dithiol-disulfide isomerase